MTSLTAVLLCVAEEIVMTPAKRGNVTHIQIEKVKKNALDETRVAHKAGGQHSGLVINKQAAGQLPSVLNL